MKVAIPIWNHRISPVFDTAQKVLVVEYGKGREIARSECGLSDADFFHRVERLRGLGVDRLICGAISKPLELELAAQGIQVFSHCCGEAEEVLAACVSGQGIPDRFAMPGCCGQRRFRCRRQGEGYGKKGMRK